MEEKTPISVFKVNTKGHWVVPENTSCICKRCGPSNIRWYKYLRGDYGGFEAVSFGIKHLTTEEIHAAITLYDDKVFHSILKHLLKRKGEL